MFVPRSREYDLREMVQVRRLLDDANPDVLIHLAAVVGGIGSKLKHSRQILLRQQHRSRNQIIEAAQVAGGRWRSFVLVRFAPIKIHSGSVPGSEFWDGYPEETNARLTGSRRRCFSCSYRRTGNSMSLMVSTLLRLTYTVHAIILIAELARHSGSDTACVEAKFF